jgi:PqqD family protein of HPr-rel-A system
MPDPTLTAQSQVRRIEDVLDTEIDDQTVMMDIEQGSYFGLNKPATRIWAMLAEPIVIDELCDRLTEEFDVPREQCEQQVGEFLANLLDRGLLQVVTNEST